MPAILGILPLLLVVQPSPAALALAQRRAPIGAELGWPLFRFSLGDTVEIVARRIRPLGRSTTPAPSSYLAVPVPQIQRSRGFSTLTHLRTFDRPLAQRMIYGADRFAGAAAALGGLGLVSGLWEDRTAGALMGAGALLGTPWGGTLGADHPGIRIGVDTRPLDAPGRARDPGVRKDR